ncbi:FHA domain-containing protein [Aliiglaciecola sp. SL4]|uniref:FHA domain-containing protein n=1 Tax=Aliiglaciecola sp. SL4 TaxID=3239806 RepID=UPI00355BB1F1
MPLQVNISTQSGWVKEHILFEGKDYSIGRSDDADVIVEHPQVSRNHARLSSSEDNQWVFQDTSSSGSFYLGKQVNSLQLDSENVIQLGPAACRFKKLTHQQLTALNSQSEWRKNQLQHLSKQFSNCANSQDLLQTTQHCLIQTLGCERAALILINEDKSLQQCLGFEAWMQNKDFSGSRSIIERCLERREPLAIGTVQDDQHLSQQYSVIKNNIQAAMCVPVYISENIQAVLYADNTTGKQYFTQTDITLIESFANLLSLRLLFQSIEHNISLARNH